MSLRNEDPSETIRLLRQAADGDQHGWREVLERHRERLRRMISIRMDRRVQGRLDPSDVIQDTFVDAWEQLRDYLREPGAPFYLWLRAIAGNKLMAYHRHHLGTQMRDAKREISLYHGAMPETTSAALAAILVGGRTQPSEAAIRAEMKTRLQECLNSLDPIDREVLTLRHFEQLTNAEAARVLGIASSAASKRYLRALERLKVVLAFPAGDA